MATAQGFSESVILGPETTFKNPPGTPVGVKLPVSNPKFSPNVNRFNSDAIVGTAEPRPLVDGKVGVDVSLDLECNRQSLGYPLKGLFAAPVNQGTTGQYDHIYTLATGAKPSFYIEQQFSDISQFLVYEGIRIGKGSFTFDSEGLMKATFTGMGAVTSAPVGSAYTASVNTTDVTGEDPLRYMSGTVSVNGTAVGYIKKLTVDVDTQLEKVMTIDGTNQLSDIIAKVGKVTGTISTLFQDVVMYNYALNSTNTAVSINVPSTTSGHGLKVFLSSVKLKPTGPVSAGSGGLVTADYTYEGQGQSPSGDTGAFAYTKAFSTVTVVAADTLVWKIDGGADLTTSLTSGVGRTIAQISTDINATVGFSAAATCVIENGRLLITSKQVTLTGSASSVKVTNGAGTPCTYLGLVSATTTTGFSGKSVIFILTNQVASY